ncbi:MAG: hypothetical protein VB076_08525 [Synergistaceae bacterium]|nr:hypothetical protein [Synergistaceae bacterium]
MKQLYEIAETASVGELRHGSCRGEFASLRIAENCGLGPRRFKTAVDTALS